MATDDFNRANGALGANWGAVDTGGGTGDPQIASNVVIGQSGWGSGGSASRYTASSFSADQYSQAVVGGLVGNGSDEGGGVIVRASADQDGAKDYYGLRVVDGTGSPRTVLIGKYVNGTWTQLSTTSTAVVSTDTIRLEVDGTSPANLRAYINGAIVSALTTTDSSLTAGNPGLVGTPNANLDTWDGGDLSVPVAQQDARFGLDDGSESAHTWAAAQGANLTAPLGTYLLRFVLQATGDPNVFAPTLRYAKNGGAYNVVPVGATVPEVYGTVTFGAIGTGANGSTSVAPSYPTGITAGQYLTCVVTSGATNSETPTTPSGWTLLGTGASTDGTFGVDTGPRRVTVFGKVADGTESGTLTVNITNGNTCRGTISRWTKSGSGTWAIEAKDANDSSSGTGFSATTASMNWNTGDAVLVAVGQRVDSATQSSQSLTASGVTFGTLTNRATTAVTTGNDHRHVVDTTTVSATSDIDAAPTWAYTASASVSGGLVVVRLREYTAEVSNEVYVATSSNVAAGGEATTQRLTGGTGTFLTGRRWDDENGTDTLDPASNQNTEVEWAVAAAGLANATTLDFRVYGGASPLTSYGFTPRWTIGTPPGPRPPIRPRRLRRAYELPRAMLLRDVKGMPAAARYVAVTTINGGIGTAAAEGQQAAIALGTVIAGGIGSAAASGLQASVVLTTAVAGGVGVADASGLAAAVTPSTAVAGGIGQADASGLAASISGTTGIAGGVGLAEASGLQASIALTTAVAAGVGVAAASGLAAAVTLSTSVVGGVGQAEASGLLASISGSTGIPGGVGQADASGLQAGIALTTAVAGGVGVAAASGLAAAVTPSTSVAGGIGQAEASGLIASISGSTGIAGGVGLADASGVPASIALTTVVAGGVAVSAASGLQAGISVSSGATINGEVATAAASGLPASVVLTTRIDAQVGSAAAAGLPAGVALGTAVAGTVGVAAAAGLQATIVTGELIAAGVAVAVASGLGAQIVIGSQWAASTPPERVQITPARPRQVPTATRNNRI